MPSGLHLEGLERLDKMFKDMWFRLTETLEKEKCSTPWWKGMLRILGRKQIMQHTALPSELLLEGLERLDILFKDLWWRQPDTLERHKSSTLWWKGMLGIL